ncbi:hypothetical protein GS399_05795 [Pedobacter sp. HMF7647]|uniref:Uncharacterized protein n=1 Tax=Hufsiella arboris TaxID=2695275 RepID=A0A7K1Y8T5_9SPHI|nr:hypothetical protein [Hufsiella arboris]MXV50479.1 hypothetical protein [Hufsiella arboris]
MSISPVLDLVILLSFTYFIGSLILSAINEAIAGGLRLRPKQLKFALEHIFFDKDWKFFIQRNIARSPHIQSLMKKNGRYPAYIPAKNFVLAVIEQFKNSSEDGKSDYGKVKLSESVDKLVIPVPLKKILYDFAIQVEAIHSDPGRQVAEFEKRIEDFYNSTMDRAGGWYKRKTRTMLLIIAIVLSVILNIDTVKITQDALRDKEKLGKAVDNITANLSKAGELNSLNISDTSVSIKTRISKADSTVKQIKLVYEASSGYTLGFTSSQDFLNEWKKHFWAKIIGILITAFALQLGSNYWFDLMNKAVNIRAAGKRPDEKRPPQDITPTKNN